jgi:hypothetical protein
MSLPHAGSFRGAARYLHWLGVPAAIALASLSFAQAAAGVGLPFRWSAPLGASFHAWEPASKALEEALSRPGSARLDAARLQQAERRILSEQPLASAALRLGAWSEARQGREAQALARVRAIERLTRRDALAQLWLLEDAARRDDMAGVLRRYDAVLRTQTDLRDPLLAKLATQLGSDAVRRGLAPYADASSPWFPQLLQLAGSKGQASGVAALLSGLPVLPDTPLYRSGYAAVVVALAGQNDFASLRRIYPRLPGASVASLTDLGFGRPGPAQGYAPFSWNLAISPERSARQEADALDVRAEPFGIGPVASRLILPPPGRHALSWTVERADQGAAGAGAYWAIRCRDTGQLVRSPNLLGSSRGVLAVPHPCAAADLVLGVDGGNGGEGPAFRLTRLRLLSTEK